MEELLNTWRIRGDMLINVHDNLVDLAAAFRKIGNHILAEDMENDAQTIMLAHSAIEDAIDATLDTLVKESQQSSKNTLNAALAAIEAGQKED